MIFGLLRTFQGAFPPPPRRSLGLVERQPGLFLGTARTLPVSLLRLQSRHTGRQGLTLYLGLGPTLFGLLGAFLGVLELLFQRSQALAVLVALFGQGLFVGLGVLLAGLPLLLERLGTLLGLLLGGFGAGLGHGQGTFGLDAGLIDLLGLALCRNTRLPLLVSLLLEGGHPVAGLGQLLPGLVALGFQLLHPFAELGHGAACLVALAGDPIALPLQGLYLGA